jgi:hypothetical protein
VTRPTPPQPTNCPSRKDHIDTLEFLTYIRLENQYVRALEEEAKHWKLLALGPQ